MLNHVNACYSCWLHKVDFLLFWQTRYRGYKENTRMNHKIFLLNPSLLLAWEYIYNVDQIYLCFNITPISIHLLSFNKKICDKCTEFNLQVTEITDQTLVKVPMGSICFMGQVNPAGWQALMKWNFLIFDQEIFPISSRQLPCKESNIRKNSNDHGNLQIEKLGNSGGKKTSNLGLKYLV